MKNNNPVSKIRENIENILTSNWDLKGSYVPKKSLANYSKDLYLNNSSFSKVKPKKKSLIKKTKEGIAKFISNPFEGIENIVDTFDTIVFNPSTNIIVSDAITEENSKITESISKKSLYSSFINYSKRAYETVKRNAKKVAGNVKYTIAKFANLSFFLKAALNPNWNFAPASALDRDTHAPTETQNSSIDEKYAKYQTGWEFLKYKTN